MSQDPFTPSSTQPAPKEKTMSYHSIEKHYQQDPERLITREEAARMLGIQPATLAKWACQRKTDLPMVKIGSRVRYRLLDVKEFIKLNTRGGS